MCNQYILIPYPTGKKCPGIGLQEERRDVDPFKYPPRDQSLLGLGHVLSWPLLPGRGSGGKVGDQEDVFVAFVRSHPEHALGGGGF